MPPRPPLRVPTTVQVRPGARVHIVLKQDQPTGRTVAGVVQAVLTRGNHPRGIKVRLADGRVGRVQAMGETAAIAGSGSAVSSASSAPSAPVPTAPPPAPPAAWTPPIGPGPTDVRDEPVPLEQIGLDAFIRPAKQKKKRGDRSTTTPNTTNTSTTPPLTTCPVCGDFRGDADAVAHHVAGHFDA